MPENMFKSGATREQREIIKKYFGGATVKTLVKEYAASHMIKSEKTHKDITMPIEMASKKISEALSFINWG